MKSALLLCWMALFAVSVSAQDFASRFLTEQKNDSNINCITISPKMMEEILKKDIDNKNDEMLNIISNLKSMQLLTANVSGKCYYSKAMSLAEKNKGRYELVLTHEGDIINCQIFTRKRRGTIIELVMLMHEKERFSIINFTGNMEPEFIAKLTGSMSRKDF